MPDLDAKKLSLEDEGVISAHAPLVMLVDDEQNILSSLRRVLRREGWEIVTATSGPEALALLDREPRAVSVVVCDFRMPEMNGAVFLSRVRERCKDAVRILLSGYADTQMVQDAINEGRVHRFIGKPWDDEELRVALRSAVAEAASARGARLLMGQIASLQAEVERADSESGEMGEGDGGGSARDLMRAEAATEGCVPPIWQEIVDSVPVAIVGIDREQTVVLANPFAEEILGIDRCAVLGAPASECLPAELAQIAVPVALTGDGSTSRAVVLNGARVRVGCVPLGAAGGKTSRGALLFAHRLE